MTNLFATLIPLLSQIQLYAIKILDILDLDLSELLEDIWNNLQVGFWDFIGIDNLIDASIGDSALQSLNQILFMGSKSGGIYTYYWSAINSVLGIVKPIGYAIITTFFIIYIFDLASKDQMTFDMIVKLAVQLIVVVAIAGNLDTIINTFLSISDSMLNSIINTNGLGDPTQQHAFSTVGNTYGKQVLADWTENKGENFISAFFKALFLYIFHQISVIGVYFAAFSRSLDIGWRIAFAPIGVANSFEGGANSAGVRYLKGLLGAILSGVLVYVIIVLSYKMSAGLLVADSYKANTFASVACLLAGAGAAIGVSTKSKELIG